jgi:hypothetical protein
MDIQGYFKRMPGDLTIPEREFKQHLLVFGRFLGYQSAGGQTIKDFDF